MAYGKADIEATLELLPRLVSRDEVNGLLRERKIAFSAPNWDAFIRDRLRPALESDELPLVDLVRFVSSAEEYGRQHVFLYRMPSKLVAGYINDQHLSSVAAKLGVSALLTEPRILSQPTNSMIGDLRIDRTDQGNPKALVAKVVETRLHRELIGEEELPHDNAHPDYKRVVVRRYGELPVRAVNVLQLNSNGILEVRIQTHQSAMNYGTEASAMLMRLKDLVLPKDYRLYPISNAKANLWRDKEKLRDRIDMGSSLLRDTAGAVMTMAPGNPQASLLESPGACRATDGFLEEEGSFEKADVRVFHRASDSRWWRGERRTHIVLGALNEFTVLGQCFREDHEDVLKLIVTHNGPVAA